MGASIYNFKSLNKPWLLDTGTLRNKAMLWVVLCVDTGISLSGFETCVSPLLSRRQHEFFHFSVFQYDWREAQSFSVGASLNNICLLFHALGIKSTFTNKMFRFICNEASTISLRIIWFNFSGPLLRHKCHISISLVIFSLCWDVLPCFFIYLANCYLSFKT